MTPQIEIFLNVQNTWVDETLCTRLTGAMHALLTELLALPPGPDHVLSTLETVEIAIVDDATIARVHGQYLNDPTSTDVITFPYGEILVSCDTAERYAAAHALSREEELFRYMVHGLVHLHGYLDAQTEEREALFAVQEPLVARHMPK